MNDRWLYQALSTPGVTGAEKLVTQFANWKKPSGGEQIILIVGSEPHTSTLTPWNFIAGDPAALSFTNTVTVDRLYLEKLGIDGVGDTVEINGHRARVVGITEGIRSFTTSPFVFSSLKNSLDYAGLGENEMNYLLVHTTGEVPVEQVKQLLQARMPEVDVYTKAEFRDKTRRSWIYDTGAGAGFLTAAALGLVVGIVIVTQTLYASTIDHLNEYATLRAMGSANAFLYRIIIQQAIMSAIAGYVIGLAISLGIERLSQSGVTVILVTMEFAVVLLGVTVLMCVLAAITSIRKVTRVEPAMVFKG
jgi:putative ABC transport system permease protein